MDKEKELLVGLRAHEREKKLVPEGVQLADGSPLYYTFLEDPMKIDLSAEEVQIAKNKLSLVIAVDRDKVLSCQGKTREEAIEILKSIESL